MSGAGAIDEPIGKGSYAAFLQCRKRLWLEQRAPELAREEPSAPALRESGREVGVAARHVFPDAVLVDEAAPFPEALERTRELMRDASVEALLEPAFEHAGLRARPDALERLPGGGWRLVEVKAGTAPRQAYLDDVAFQVFVLRGAGVDIPQVELLLVSGDYVRGEGAVDWSRYFERHDVRDDVELLLEDLPDHVCEMRELLAGGAPAVEPSPHCRRPLPCPFWAACTEDRPLEWIGRLPGLREGLHFALREAQVERIPAVPDDTSLSDRQRRAVAACRRGSVLHEPGLAPALRELGPPTRYLDFETLAPAIPLWPGTRPYQAIPCQFSLHAVEGNGRRWHREYLFEGSGDPRRAFAAELLEALGGAACPVLVYSSFEAEVLAELEEALPELRGPLRALRRRLVDLLEIVRDHVYHPEFAGSYSIKRVAPALVPGFGYGDLEEIAEGGSAALWLERFARGRVPSGRAPGLQRALLRYCARDTEALLEIHAALRRLVQ